MRKIKLLTTTLAIGITLSLSSFTTESTSGSGCSWEQKEWNSSSAIFYNSDKGNEKIYWDYSSGDEPYYKFSVGGSSFGGGSSFKYYVNDGEVWQASRKLGKVSSLKEAILMALKDHYCN